MRQFVRRHGEDGSTVVDGQERDQVQKVLIPQQQFIAQLLDLDTLNHVLGHKRLDKVQQLPN